MKKGSALQIFIVLVYHVHAVLGHSTPVLTGQVIFEGDGIEGPLQYYESVNEFRINAKVNVDSPLSEHSQLEITCTIKTTSRNETTQYSQVQQMKGKYHLKDIKGEDTYKKQFTFTGSFSTRNGFTAYRECDAKLTFLNPHTQREQLKNLKLIGGRRDYKFVESLIAEYSKWIKEWFPKKNFTLLIKKSQTFSYQNFHTKVDGKGPTVILGVEALTGILYGGYTSKSWGGRVRRVDPEAFIFRINCASPECWAKKFVVKDADMIVIHDDPDDFPSFGNDELAFEGCKFNPKNHLFQLTENLGAASLVIQ